MRHHEGDAPAKIFQARGEALFRWPARLASSNLSCPFSMVNIALAAVSVRAISHASIVTADATLSGVHGKGPPHPDKVRHALMPPITDGHSAL